MEIQVSGLNAGEYIGKSESFTFMEDSKKGLRTVALFEAAKGLVVLLAGFGIFALFHHDAQHVAENIVRHLHMNPARHVPQVFIKAASELNNTRLLLFALGALAYSLLRFVEAYGLWRERRWAMWLAAIGGGIYLPLEIPELFHHVTWEKVVVVTVNVGIVIYAVLALIKTKGSESFPRK